MEARGQDLRAAREAAGLSLGDVARFAGLTRGHLSRVERGVDNRPVTHAIIWAYRQAGVQFDESSTTAAMADAKLAALPSTCVASMAPREVTQQSDGHLDEGTPSRGDDMIRRDFLRILAVAGAALPILPGAETVDGSDFLAMNQYLWRVYQLARSKRGVYPIVRDQLEALSDELKNVGSVVDLCAAAGDLLQLAGELAFDQNRYTDAAAAYTLAASASHEAGHYDLWACALTRHAYVSLYDRQYAAATGILTAAERIARRGDSRLATRHWVAALQAQAFAGLGDLAACQRAMDEAEQVLNLSADSVNGGWLRFDSSRLAEERGARYVELGRLDLAEEALHEALRQAELSRGHSYRRRGAVLADLAVLGARRRDIREAVTYAREAVDLARRSGSGYVARKLRTLRVELRPVASDPRVAELNAELAQLAA